MAEEEEDEPPYIPLNIQQIADVTIPISRRFRLFYNWIAANEFYFDEQNVVDIYNSTMDYFYPAYPAHNSNPFDFTYIVCADGYFNQLNFNGAIAWYNKMLQNNANARIITRQAVQSPAIKNNPRYLPVDGVTSSDVYYRPADALRAMGIEPFNYRNDTFAQFWYVFNPQTINSLQGLLNSNPNIAFALYTFRVQGQICGGFTLFDVNEQVNNRQNPNLPILTVNTNPFLAMANNIHYLRTTTEMHPVVYEYTSIDRNNKIWSEVFKFHVMIQYPDQVPPYDWRGADCPLYHNTITHYHQTRHGPPIPIYNNLAERIRRTSIDRLDMYLRVLVDNAPNSRYRPRGEISLRQMWQMIALAVERVYYYVNKEVNLYDLNDPDSHLIPPNRPLWGRDRDYYYIVFRFYTMEGVGTRREEWFRHVRWASIKSDYADMRDWLTRICTATFNYEDGESDDPITAGARVDTSSFHIRFYDIDHDINYYPVVLASGKSRFMIYDTISQVGNSLSCIPYAISQCLYLREKQQHVRNLKQCKHLNELIDYIQQNHLAIDIMYNIPQYKVLDYKLDWIAGKTSKTIKPRKGKNTREAKYWPLFDRDITHCWAFKSGKQRVDILVYDHERHHIECLRNYNNIKLKGDVYVSGQVDVIRILEYTDEQKEAMGAAWHAEYDEAYPTAELANAASYEERQQILRGFAFRPYPVMEDYVIVRDFRKRVNAIVTKKEEEVKFIFVDLECVTDEDEDQYSSAYSASWCILDLDNTHEMEEIETLSRRNMDLAELRRDEFKEKYCNHVTGFGCVQRFLLEIKNYMARMQIEFGHINYKYRLVGFNNSQYDNFMILKELQGIYHDTGKINNIEFHGPSRIGEIVFFDRRCSVLDMRRHLTIGTLNDLCKNFGVVLFGKKPDLISHRTVQLIYNESKRMTKEFFISEFDYDEHDTSGILNNRDYKPKLWELFSEKLYEQVPRDDLKDYNDYDVLSLALLFHKYVADTMTMDCLHELQTANITMKPVYYHCSLPSYLFCISNKLSKKNNITLGTVHYADYSFIRKGSVAGRICYFGKRNRKYEHEVVSLDVCSMYPYTMFCAKDVWFPCGGTYAFRDLSQPEYDEVMAYLQANNYTDFPRLGYYTVDIDQSILVENNKPLFVCKKTDQGNNWEYDPEVIKQENIVLSTVEILFLWYLNCEVKLKVGQTHLLYSCRIEAYRIFYWLVEFMKKKNEEDAKPVGQRNEGKREANKLRMNCISGKYFQKILLDVIEQISKHTYHQNLATKRMRINSDEIIGTVDPHTFLVKYELDSMKETTKPTFIGSHIYVYSRIYMYRTLLYPLGNDKCYYHDTDSVKFAKSDFDEIIKPIFEQQMVEHNDFILQHEPRYATHKLYEPNSKVFGSFENELEDGNHITFIHDKKEWACFKLDDDKENIIWKKFKFKGVSKKAIVIFHNEIADIPFIRKKGKKYIITNQDDCLKYDDDNHDAKCFDNNDICFSVFENLYRGNPVYFINQQFKRDIEKCSVKVQYILKKIQNAQEVEQEEESQEIEEDYEDNGEDDYDNEYNEYNENDEDVYTDD